LDAARTLVGAALLLVLAAIAGAYAAQPVANIDYEAAPGVEAPGEGVAPAQGEGEPGDSGESETATVTLVVAEVYRAGSGGASLPYVKSIVVESDGSKHKIVVEVELPTPCHNATLSYNGSLLAINISSPAGAVCVQALKPVVLSIEWQGPPPQELVVEVYRDGRLLARAVLPVNPPY